jgi:hypothetical protein
VRSVPADARIDVSVRFNLRVWIVSVPQVRVAVGWVRVSSQISIAEDAVAKIGSV